MSMTRHLFLIGAAAGLAAACSSTPKPQPEKSEPVASPAVANEKLGGTWLLSIQRGGQSTDHSLHLQLTAGELVGSLTGPDGNSREVGKVALAGDKVTWEIGSSSQGGMVQRFEGKLTGASSMEGSIKMVRADRSGKKGGGQRGGGGSSGSSGSDSGDSSGSSSGDGTAPSDGGGTSSGGSGSGRGGRGGHGRGGGRGGSSGTTVTWRAYKIVELPAIPAPTPAKAGL
jgi:hypothetical protein